MEYAEYALLRDKHEYCDADVAKGAGIDKSTLSNWKAGRSKPKIEKLTKILDFLGENNKAKTIEDLAPLPEDREPTAQEVIAQLRSMQNDEGFIDIETQKLVRNPVLKKLLFAGGKAYAYDPQFVEALIYTLQKVGEIQEEKKRKGEA